ncbi:pentapeptide repeat-containing protein [Nostoc sp.]
MDGEELLQRYASGERDFSGADLRKAGIFDGRRLIFKDAIFKGVNLSGIIEYRIDFSGAGRERKFFDIVIHRANLEGVDLRDIALSRAFLSNANLSGANLNKVNFWGANLSGANLADSEMNHADLRGADLNSADMVAVDLSGANMTDAYWKTTWLLDARLWNTICPNG